MKKLNGFSGGAALSGLIVIGCLVAASFGAPALAQTEPPFPGSIDTNFGLNGKVMLPSGMSVAGLAVQSIGGEERIVVVGGTPSSRKTRGAWMVIRYRANGVLDTTFGSGGIVKYISGSGNAAAAGVAVQPDQKLLVSGSVPPLAKPYTMATLPTIIRYNANGTVDTSFGKAGFAQVRCPANNKVAGDSYAVILQSDLKIVALAYWAGHLGVFRLNSNGSLDASFNGIGQYYETKPSCAFGMTSQWVDSDERIVVSGNRDGLLVPGAYSKGLLMRFTSAGLLDPGFGDAGVVLTDFTPYNDGYGPVEADAANRLVVGWAGDDHTGGPTQYLVVRHAINGSLDARFGPGGKASPVPPGFTWTNAIQADGNILASGLSDGLMSVWRFTDSGLLDTTFGGNGWISADFGGANAQDIVLQSDGKFVVGGGNFIARFWQ